MAESELSLGYRQCLEIHALHDKRQNCCLQQDDARSLETFTVGLDGALSNLVWLRMSLLTAGGLS